MPGRIAAKTLETLSGSAAPGRGPAVTVSWAQSRDGAIAAPGGVRTALSCPESLALTHRLRAMHGAILVGIGTVLADDPLLSVRLAPGPQPQPVVLDTQLRFPLSARLLAREDRRPWIFHAGPAGAKGRELTARGARLFAVHGGPSGLDLREVLDALADEGIASVMVEGGAQVLRSFLRAGLAGQAVVTVCPFRLDGLRVLEGTREGTALPEMADVLSEPCGRDTVVWGQLRRHGRREEDE